MKHRSIDEILLPPEYPKAKAAEIRRVEKSLGVVLPAELKAIWTSHGGGRLRYNSVVPAETPPRSHTSRAVYEMECLQSFHGKGGGWGFEQTVSNAHEVWGLDRKLIPLDGDGHFWTCLDYRRSATPSVVHVETDSGEITVVARSFDQLLAGLVRGSQKFTFTVAGPIAAVARQLETLGLRRERSGQHDRWTWKALRSSHGDAQVVVGPNTAREFTQVPDSALLLSVAVEPKFAPKAVRQLARTLGPRAALIHQPIDVPPVSLADLDREPLPYAVKPPPQFTPADVYDAARAGDLKAMKKFITLGWKPTAPMFGRDSAIGTAAAYGQTAVLKLLLKHASGKVPAARAFESAVSQRQPASIKALAAAGHTPTRRHLGDAVLFGHLPTIKALLAAGARPTKHTLWMYGGKPDGEETDPEFIVERKEYEAKMTLLRKYVQNAKLPKRTKTRSR